MMRHAGKENLPLMQRLLSGTANGTYKYDGNLKRVKSDVNGETIYNVYDSSGALVHVHELDPINGNKRTNYVDGPSGTLARIENNLVTYLHPDYLGSAQSGTNSTGSVVWREQYTPFGEVLQGQAANDDQAGFTGHIKDSATGLNYMQARYYDPTIGRFLSVDTVGFTSENPMSFNRYLYVNNNPYKYTDPNGEFLNFAVKFVADVALNVAINYATTGEANLGGALTESALGAFNPASTLKKVQKLGNLVTDGRRAPDVPKDAPQLVYRGGSATPNNLTPRPGQDLDGLSTFDSLEAAVGPGGKAQVIDTTKLNTLCATCTPPAGHVSISAGDAAANAEWAATRGTGTAHPATQEVMDAIVDTVRRPK